MGSGTRIGDAERDQVVDRLSELFVAGALTKGELDERVEEALRARTTVQLEALVEDCTPVRARAAGGRAPGLRYVVAAVAAAALLVPAGLATGALVPDEQTPQPICAELAPQAAADASSCLVSADD